MAFDTLNPDVTVRISMATPVITPGLGTPLVMTKAVTPAADFKPAFYKFTSAKDVADKFGGDKPVAKVAQLIFGQQNRPEHIDVVEYVDLPSALSTFQEEDWMFALLADVTDQNTVATFAMAVSEIANKFGAIQVPDVASLSAIGNPDNIIGFVHPLDKGRLDAAAVGNIANLQAGSVTWKFKQVSGIAENGFTGSQLTAIDQAHGIALKPLTGTPILSAGVTLGGKHIDDIHARIWIEQQLVASLSSVLMNSGKLPYDNVGITKIKSAIALVFDRAYNLGLLATDEKTGRAMYVVNATPRSQQTVADISQRFYAGSSFSYVQSGAIENINVSGQVVDAL